MGAPLKPPAWVDFEQTENPFSDHLLKESPPQPLTSAIAEAAERPSLTPKTDEQEANKEVNENVQKVKKSTWRKIKDWCTRAYRISEIAKKKPERVRTAGRHIIVLGMLLGLGPSLLSTLSKPFRTPTPQPSPPPVSETTDTSPKKAISQRIRLMTSSSDGDEDDDDENLPEAQSTPRAPESAVENNRNHHIGPQVYITTQSQASPFVMASAAAGTSTHTSPEVISVHQSVPEDIQQPQTAGTDTQLIHLETTPPPETQTAPEQGVEELSPAVTETRNTSRISLFAAFRGEQQQDLLGVDTHAEEMDHHDLWRTTDVSLSMYPSFQSNDLGSEAERFSPRASDLDMTDQFRLESREYSLPPLPEIDLIHQLTHETEGILPAEIAYEWLMQIAINGVRKFREFFRKEEREIDMSEEPRRTTVRVRTGFEDIISGGDAQLRISLDRIVLKGGIEIELPWDNGELELEGIARLEPFEEMPLNTLTFQATYEHPVLGGVVQIRGSLDFEPTQENPFTVMVRARFNRVIYNNAHFNVEGLYEQTIGQEPFFGLTAGFSFEWGPGAPEEAVDYSEMDRTERRLRRRWRPERILSKVANRAARTHHRQIRRHQHR